LRMILSWLSKLFPNTGEIVAPKTAKNNISI